jgi:hypothetical protein
MDPMGPSIAPEMEENFEEGTLKRVKFKDMKTHKPGGNQKTKNSIQKVDNSKILSKATKHSLEKQTNDGWAKLDLATPKRSNEEKITSQNDGGNRAIELTFDHSLNPNT